MTRTDFEAQMDGLLPGEGLAYHMGNLLVDRRIGLDFMRVENTARAAWNAMMAGKVHLMQKRIGEARYAYCAVKKAPPFKVTEWCGCYDDRPLNVKPVPTLKKAA